MQTQTNPVVQPGEASVVDPAFTVLLPSGEQGTWNISQNLTDRWGEFNFYEQEKKPLQPLIDDAPLYERLLNQMWGEITFVVRKDGNYGILYEVEFYSEESEEDASLMPQAQVVDILRTQIEGLLASYPDVQFCIPPAAEIVEERPAIWAFVADGALEEKQREALGRALLSF